MIHLKNSLFNQYPKTAKIISADQHHLSTHQISEQARSIIDHLNENGFQAFIVGGCVRDLLMNKKPKDFDIVTDASPTEIKQLFSHCCLIGHRFRLAHIHFGKREFIEVATFRALCVSHQTKDGLILQDNQYGTIEEDAHRRDFTINALYYDPQNSIILDFTEGFQDLRHRKLRLIGDPETRYREDPVRMIRAIRFMGKLDLIPISETKTMIFKLLNLLENISPARLYDETIKLFQCGFAEKTFLFAEQYGLFQYLFPLTENCLHKNQTRSLIIKALNNTDLRIREKKHVIPSFLFAALLWPPFIREIKKHRRYSSQKIKEIASKILKQQSRCTTIPQWVQTSIQHIWQCELRLEKNPSQASIHLLRHPRFRAAYDLLVLRSSFNKKLIPIANWWTTFQSANLTIQTEST